MKESKSIAYYVYEIEAPQKQIDLLRKIAESNHMTISEMTVEALKHIAAHPNIIQRWEKELEALPEEKKKELSQIKVRRMYPVYKEDISLQPEQEEQL